MRKSITSIASFILLCWGGSRALFASTPPLKGDASDSDGNLEWISQATQQSQRWSIGNWVTNRAQSGHLRVEWKPDVYDGWVPAPPAPTNRRGSNVDGGKTEPQERDGTIQYGKNGNKAAPSYAAGPSKKEEVETVSCDLRLTVRIKNALRDISIKAISTAMPPKEATFEVRYTVVLEQKDLAAEIQIEWAAAASPLLKKVLLERHGQTLIRLDQETSTGQYTILSNARPVLNDGALIVRDRDGRKLGAAYAPAYAPPAER
jgi:hypothetical protein